jgi:hypothetical protein
MMRVLPRKGRTNQPSATPWADLWLPRRGDGRERNTKTRAVIYLSAFGAEGVSWNSRAAELMQ